MPWCEECAKYWTPNSVNDDGTCPQCGHDIEHPVKPAGGDTDDEKTPWHFKLMVATLIVYLTWRVVQLFT